MNDGPTTIEGKDNENRIYDGVNIYLLNSVLKFILL